MNINQFRKTFPDEATCRKYLEKTIWFAGRVCPHYGGLKSWAFHSGTCRDGLYECAECHGQFTVTTKTPMHSTKLPLRTWLLTAMYFITYPSKGVSSVFLGKWLGVKQKTAWKMGHAIRAMMAAHAETLGGGWLGLLNSTKSIWAASRALKKESSTPGVKQQRKPVYMWLSVVIKPFTQR